MINYRELEVKWQKAWADARIFEPEPNDKEGLLVTAAIPYVNSPPHIGHLRTYGTADTYARYMRMMGFNVLYPFGFHATGTPVVAFAKRIFKNDKDLIRELKLFHVSDNDIKKMVDPVFITEYFMGSQEAELRKAGLGIDWRRKFVTIEPMFSKLIEWQFGKLKEKGLLIQGVHPVGWCINENNAVGQHDTRGDVQPKIEDILAIKFKEKDGDTYFVCATYRPETIYGVTNLFVNKNGLYVKVMINDEHYYLTKEAMDELHYQFDIKFEAYVAIADLLKKMAINPETNEEVPVLPGFFVKSDVGTGTVMSVPAHAPFDYAAIERLKTEGYPVPPMSYKKLIDIEPVNGVSIGRSLGENAKSKPSSVDIPAVAYLELLGASPAAADDTLEFATKMVYREESHWGVMLVGKYAGKKETDARDSLKHDMLEAKTAFSLYQISNPEPVICRCGYRVIVNIVKDQWFINYGDQKWKDEVSKALLNIRIYPTKYRRTFDAVLEWIDARAAERAQGLGTKFPLNPEHIIESLSDSTIYMVFYTFDNVLRNANVKPEMLKPELFDYLINSIGDQATVSTSTGIDGMTIKKCKDSLDYWYKNTSRHSAPDLIYNHFMMYIFNHVALLPQGFYPKQIVVNGMVNYEGEKMSKSLGNIVPLGDGIEKYGSDPLRFIEISGADLDTDTEFSVDAIGSVISKNEFMLENVESLGLMAGVELEHIDYWLYSKLHAKIGAASEAMAKLEYRSAYTEIYYNSVAELKHYIDRGGHSSIVVKEFLDTFALMMAPIMPHLAEEIWHKLGNTTLAAQQKWPVPDKSMINEAVEKIENTVGNTIDDITQVIALTSKMDVNKGKKVKEIKIIVAENWKRLAYNMLLDRKEVARVIKDGEFKSIDPAAISKFLGPYMNKLPVLMRLPEISSKDLYDGLVGARGYIKRKFDAEVTLEMESASKSSRAGRALPDKPSIDVVWG